MDNLVIRLADLPKDLPQIHKIRYLVFQIEQGVDPTLEFDDKDEEASHVLVYWNQKAIGTTRIRFLNEQTVKLERFALLKEARGLGIGRRMMEFILDWLHQTAVEVVVMNAQIAVKEFYEKFGFVPEGNVFEEAGIPHIRMKKLLR
ncbi:MAG: GNAT family N-acetyltransferase [Leptolyngbyaceae cyanobacterium bins.302]|nr:GNAT family N-acetyltransferase [Leptolyngbyaceae cyanobacterium bins.302]